MNSVIFKAFAKHASGGPDTPNDYLATKIAVMQMFPKLANDYANDLARRAAQAGKLRPVRRLLTKLGMGLDSHAMLAQSLYHNNSPNMVAQIARANPAHKSGILSGIKNIAPALGGVRTMGSNPLRAAASGVLHAKLAGVVGTVAKHVGEAAGKTGPWGHAAEIAGLGILARPSIQKLRGKQVSHRSEAGHELVGLGTLAAPSAYHLLTGH